MPDSNPISFQLFLQGHFSMENINRYLMKIHSTMKKVKEVGRKDKKNLLFKINVFSKLEYGENLHAL